jgi:hypothetical protein
MASVLSGFFGELKPAEAIPPAANCSGSNINERLRGADGIGLYQCRCVILSLVGSTIHRVKCDWILIANGSGVFSIVADDGGDNNTVNTQILSEVPGGQSYANTFAYSGDSFAFRPAGSLALRLQTWRWNGSAWGVCVDSGYIYNSSATYGLGAWYTYGSQTPCGDGYYGTMGYGYQYNGGWKGGAEWSGYVQLTTSPFLAASSDAPAISPPTGPPPASKARPPRPDNQRPNKPLPPGLHISEGAPR